MNSTMRFVPVEQHKGVRGGFNRILSSDGGRARRAPCIDQAGGCLALPIRPWFRFKAWVRSRTCRQLHRVLKSR